MTLRKIGRHALLSLLTAPLLLTGACGEDAPAGGSDFTEGTPSEVSFSISALSPGGAATRADGVPLDPVSDNERIKDWFLVFVDNARTVRKVLNRSDAETQLTANGAVEQERFRCIIPAGTYDIYAFANITKEDLKAATGLEFTPGSTAPADIENAVWKGTEGTDGKGDTPAESSTTLGQIYDAKVTSVSTGNLNLWDASETNTGKAIPMTGFLKGVKIKNTIEENFSIEVVRMVSKMELVINNPGNQAITITGAAISPVTVTPVSLFPMGTEGPGYDFLGESAFTPMPNADYARLRHKFATALTVPAATDEKSGSASYTFYMKESLSNYNSGSFTIWLEVSYPGGVTEFLQFSPTETIKKYINRNDWIRIPITLSDFDVKVEAVFYPPIGGYPAINVGTDADGSQEFTFGTQGVFAIMPYVTDKMNGENVQPKRYTVEVDEIRCQMKPAGATGGNWKNVDWNSAPQIYANNAAVVENGKGIFNKMPVAVEPVSTALPYEILGDLNTQEGIARVTLKVNIYENEVENGQPNQGELPKHTYTRYVYIIRDNTGVK